MTRRMFDHKNRSVELGTELGRGGEAVVYNLVGNSEYVAKLYHKHVLDHKEYAEKAEKLAFMVRQQTVSINRFAAWPSATLHETAGGRTTGLIMPKIPSPVEIHDLYSSKSRKVKFPKADFRFLVRTALNCAAAFATLHSKNIVLGDVNQKNILACKNATIRLLDCDSFQITGNGKIYKCKVGVGDWTPPELDNYQMVRTKNHDNFGLAIIIFYLLFLGRHPYMGTIKGGKGGSDIAESVKQNRFAYGRNAAFYQMTPPPNGPVLKDFSANVEKMFEGLLLTILRRVNLDQRELTGLRH